MFDAVAKWSASATPGPGLTYQCQWIYNAAPAALGTQLESSGSDLNGYTEDFNADNPTITLKVGDSVGANIIAKAPGMLPSVALVIPPVTIVAPAVTAPPTNGSITITGGP